jgi:hypothetical protein
VNVAKTLALLRNKCCGNKRALWQLVVFADLEKTAVTQTPGKKKAADAAFLLRLAALDEVFNAF